MNLFYTTPEYIDGKRLVLDGQEAIHAVKVLRHREGDELFVTDGKGSLYRGEISSISKKQVELSLIESRKEERRSPGVIIAMGILKKRDRMEFAAEKCTELGAAGFILFKSDHSEKTNVRQERIENTILSAMKQSQRLWLPEAEVLNSFDELIQKMGKATEVMVADQESDTRELSIPESCSELILVVGPEGGLSAREIQLVKESGTGSIWLGEKRLRAETAAITLCFKAGLPQ